MTDEFKRAQFSMGRQCGKTELIRRAEEIGDFDEAVKEFETLGYVPTPANPMLPADNYPRRVDEVAEQLRHEVEDRPWEIPDDPHPSRGHAKTVEYLNRQVAERVNRVRREGYAAPAPAFRIEVGSEAHQHFEDAMAKFAREVLPPLRDSFRGLFQQVETTWRSMSPAMELLAKIEADMDGKPVHPKDIRDDRGIKQPSAVPPFWAARPNGRRR
ncbi:hypothetical protein KNU13_gp07 [Gordonia phage Turuncu]|uniref:Uncharacterized protein n=1 Tax=Gordonia phage Turuncu TaxID=2315610 RepID=A0A386KA35_9CAUD|nr:hypothetical protein KNU13_gp07 [Gordonia phage Turuncu]AYD82095.1 hypothetical protein SEA_TURUNCU_7 [Gordonia phage Turuncu]